MTASTQDQTMQAAVLAALQSGLFENRGMLRPSQMRLIADEILQIAATDAPPPGDLGARLNEQGLSFTSLGRASTTLVQALLRDQQVERATVTLARLDAILQDYYRAEIKRIHTEQQRMQDAVQRAMAERARETARLQAEIVERKQVAEVLHQAKESAEAASRAKSTFLAHISHELRTPLNAILGYAQILQIQSEKRGMSEMLPTLAKIRTAGNHLLTIISDILDLSKIEAEKMQLAPETFQVIALIEEIVGTATPLMHQRANSFSVDCTENLGAMHTDRHKVQQVLLNLLSNAAKFTDNGAITLHVTRERRDGGDCVIFTVTDTGIGISEEDLSLLFKPFSQVNTSTHHTRGGTGLGLAICRQLCRIMGGEIRASSAPGQGSTFTVSLPAVLEDAEV